MPKTGQKHNVATKKKILKKRAPWKIKGFIIDKKNWIFLLNTYMTLYVNYILADRQTSHPIKKEKLSLN